MTDRLYQLIAVATAGVILVGVAVGMLFGPDGDPGVLSIVLAVASGLLLCVFIVASLIHIYWGRRG
jgi:hypothetical protein